MPRSLRDEIGGQSVEIRYKTVVPGVPVADLMSSMTYPKENAKAGYTEPATETRRTLAIRFLRGKP
jgi:hypothetical protein